MRTFSFWGCLSTECLVLGVLHSALRHGEVPFPQLVLKMSLFKVAVFIWVRKSGRAGSTEGTKGGAHAGPWRPLAALFRAGGPCHRGQHCLLLAGVPESLDLGLPPASTSAVSLQVSCLLCPWVALAHSAVFIIQQGLIFPFEGCVTGMADGGFGSG